MRNRLVEYSPQLELVGESERELQAEAEASVLDEFDEMELASELLGVRNDRELDHFLGDLISSVGSSLGKVIRGPLGKSIGGVLKAAIPVAGGALGGLVGGPVGSMIGSRLASVAGNALGLELEGLSPEDREFEAARQFVRFASEAVKNAATSRSPDPNDAAQSAMAAAARRFAPGLAPDAGPQNEFDDHEPGHAGHWIRRGRTIVIVGC